MTSSKKTEKSKSKREKKREKSEIKSRKLAASPPRVETDASPVVRYAEAVRGVLYVLTGLSLLIAILLGQRGVIVSLDDIIESLFVLRMGKVILVLIGAALLVYGMKHLRIVR